jgi:hypothetical protein
LRTVIFFDVMVVGTPGASTLLFRFTDSGEGVAEADPILKTLRRRSQIHMHIL